MFISYPQIAMIHRQDSWLPAGIISGRYYARRVSVSCLTLAVGLQNPPLLLWLWLPLFISPGCGEGEWGEVHPGSPYTYMVCICSCVCGGKRSTLGVTVSIVSCHPPRSMRQCLSLAWSSSSRLGWLVSEPGEPLVSASRALGLQVYTITPSSFKM